MHLERVIRILEVVAISGGTISVSEISAATGYPMPTCYRLVQDLKAAGLLESPRKGLFRVGERFHRISRHGEERRRSERGCRTVSAENRR